MCLYAFFAQNVPSLHEYFISEITECSSKIFSVEDLQLNEIDELNWAHIGKMYPLFCMKLRSGFSDILQTYHTKKELQNIFIP
jgi:hypothetical protein